MGNVSACNLPIEYSLDQVCATGTSCCQTTAKDVFTEKEYEKLHDANKIISAEVAKRTGRLPEYGGNYCMGNADRMLGALLGNPADKNDFYYVDSTHSNKSTKVGFSGKTAASRAAEFSQYHQSGLFHVKTFKLDEEVMASIQRSYNLTKYGAHERSNYEPDFFKKWYKAVDCKASAKAISTLKTQLNKDIKNKGGYHVYYMSVAGEFHTLILVINNTNCVSPKYAIYDQHGIEHLSYEYRRGDFTDIHKGIMELISVNAVNGCHNKSTTTTPEIDKRKYINTRNRPPIEVKLWKIKHL